MMNLPLAIRLGRRHMRTYHARRLNYVTVTATILE